MGIWNIDGYKTQWPYLIDLQKMTQFHHLMIQETNLNSCEVSNEKSNIEPDMTMAANCHDEQMSLSAQMSIRGKSIQGKGKGTAAVWRRDLPYDVTLPTQYGYVENLSILQSTFQGQTLTTIGVYCPTAGREPEFRNYLAKLDSLIQQIRNKEGHLIIGGDWNISQNNNTNKNQERRKIMQTLIEKHNLTEHKPDGDTYYSKGRNKATSSQLDWILVSEGVTVTETRRMTFEVMPQGGDHIPVMYSVEIKIPPKQEGKADSQCEIDQETPSNYTNRKKIKWSLVDIPLYKTLARFFVFNIKDTIKELNTSLQIKILSDQLSLAAQLASQEPQKHENTDRKSKGMVQVEFLFHKNSRRIIKAANKAGISREESLYTLQAKLRENNSNELIKELVEAKKERVKLRQELRHQQSKWKDEKVMKLSEEIEKCLNSNSLKDLYQSFNRINKVSNGGLPNEIKYKGKTYNGNDVLNGFQAMTEDRSKNRRAEDPDDEHYQQAATIARNLSELYEDSGATITPMSPEKFSEVLDSLPREKAEDINNTCLENILHTDEETLDVLRQLTNNIILDWDEYSSVMMNSVKASMLYKQKGKPRDNPVSSYRRISIGSIFQKIIDKYMSSETKKTVRNAQGTSQYGFSSSVNYLLLTLLRENVQKYATEFGKLLICLASDISDAFSQTCRPSQLYECHLAGENYEMYKFKEATYKETYTVLMDGDRTSDLIKENLGSRQGGILSPDDFKLFYLLLDRMLKAAGLGYKIDELDSKLFLQLVADDGMSWVHDETQLMAVIHLFEYYADKYKVSFSFPKTLINIYGSKEQVKEVRESKRIKIAGNTPIYPDHAQHLGLIQCQNIEETELVNVKERIKKTTAKMFAMFGSRLKSSTPMRLELGKIIWNVYLKPTLITGLNALTVSDDSMKLLKDFEATVLRSIFKVRRKASTIHLYQMSGIENIEATLHKQVFGLLHNVWINPETPSAKFIKVILEDSKFKYNYWPRHVQKLAARYRIPDPALLLKEPPPEKETWKKYVGKKIEQHHQEILAGRIKSMKTTSFLVDRTLYNYMKEGARFLAVTRTKKEVQSSQIKALLIAGEYPTRNHEKRVRGKQTDGEECQFCKGTVNNFTDTEVHMLELCRLTEDDQAKQARLNLMSEYAAATGRCPTTLNRYLHLNPGSLTTFLLNTQHKSLPLEFRVLPHQATASFLNSLSNYCWVIHSLRLTELKLNEDNFSENGDISTQDGPDGGNDDEKSPNGKQKKISDFFKDSTNSASQVLKEHSDRRTNKEQSQLLGTVVNPGILIIQGTIMKTAADTINSNPNPEVIFRNNVFRGGDNSYTGAIEIFSHNKNLLSTLVISTCDTMSGGQYDSLYNFGRFTITESRNHSNTHGNHPVPVSILAFERGQSHKNSKTPVPPVYIHKLHEFKPLNHYTAYYVSDRRTMDRSNFATTEDWERYSRGTFLGKSNPIEPLEEWRLTPKGDPAATLLVLNWDKGDEETLRLASMMMTMQNPQLYSNLVTKLTPPSKILSDLAGTSYAKSLLDFDFGSVPYIKDATYINMSKLLEDLRTKLRRPDDYSTTYGISTQLQSIHTMVAELLDAAKPSQEDDLRKLLQQKTQSASTPNPKVREGFDHSRLGERPNLSELANEAEISKISTPSSSKTEPWGESSSSRTPSEKPKKTLRFGTPKEYTKKLCEEAQRRNIQNLANWEKKFTDAEKEGKRVPKNWRKMMDLVRRIRRDGKIPEKLPMFHTHILESPPEKLPSNYFAAVEDEITLEDIPATPISDDEGMEEYIKDATRELQELQEKDGIPKDKSTPIKDTSFPEWTGKNKAEYEQISEGTEDDLMESGEHHPSQSHSDSDSRESSEEDALETFVREDELNFDSQVPPGNKSVITYLTTNNILLECDAIADPIIEGLHKIERELFNQLQFHREFQEIVSSRQEISGRHQDSNSQEEDPEETSTPPTSTLYRSTHEEDKKEVRRLKRVFGDSLIILITGRKTPSRTLTTKKTTLRKGSPKSSTPRVLTQSVHVIHVVITSILLVISTNLANSVKFIISQLENKIYTNILWSFFIGIFYRKKSRENSNPNPLVEDCAFEMATPQITSKNSKPSSLYHTQLLQMHTRLYAAARTTHHGLSNNCSMYLYLYYVISLLLVLSTRNYHYYHVSQHIT